MKRKFIVWGKYVIVIVLFLAVYLFIGDQSMLHFWHRAKEIHHLEQQRDMYRAGAEEAQRSLQFLHQPDSLEQYAREHYFMHEANEDVYLVEEED